MGFLIVAIDTTNVNGDSQHEVSVMMDQVIMVTRIIPVQFFGGTGDTTH